MNIRSPVGRGNPARPDGKGGRRAPRGRPRRTGRLVLPVALLVAVLIGPAQATMIAPPRSPALAPAANPFQLQSVPVLLVSGWSDDEGELVVLSRRLEEAGWPGGGVEVARFADPVGSNVEHAAEVARAVQELRARTGAPRIDIVAHSMGGLSVRHYLLFNGGEKFTRRVVFLGTPHRGTVAAHLAWGDGGSEMVPGSEFLMDLNEKGTVPDGVESMTIRTRLDLRVLPMSSATLPGAPDVELCCPTHGGLLYDPEAFEQIRGFLQR